MRSPHLFVLCAVFDIKVYFVVMLEIESASQHWRNEEEVKQSVEIALEATRMCSQRGGKGKEEGEIETLGRSLNFRGWKLQVIVRHPLSCPLG